MNSSKVTSALKLANGRKLAPIWFRILAIIVRVYSSFSSAHKVAIVVQRIGYGFFCCINYFDNFNTACGDVQMQLTNPIIHMEK